MTLTELLAHWSITENPFRGEEARDDSVFARMSVPGHGPGLDAAHGSFHSDFEKIMGDLARPATAIVFGEKGSGKTAIRLQMAARVGEYNAANPTAKVLLVAHDDLNGHLGRFHERAGAKTPLESFQSMRLVDHMDALLLTIVPHMVDAVLDAPGGTSMIELSDEPKRAVRRLDPTARRSFRLLQAVYDRPELAEKRGPALARRLGVWPSPVRLLQTAALWLGPVALLAAAAWWQFYLDEAQRATWMTGALLGLSALYLALLIKRVGWDRFTGMKLARRVRRQVRVSTRTAASYHRSLCRLDLSGSLDLPITDSDEARYRLFGELRRILASFGYAGLVIVVDRVDEPTLVSGDPDRMRALVWPLLNNKFLQQPGVGVKLLLPMELRHLLFKESSAFFQDARLDKQNFIERLSWTGAMLYDMCDARLRACRPATAAPMSMLDLFAPDVTRQDVVDALDQMHQPRDAFKFLYRCLSEHASGVTRDENAWKVPKLVLDHARKQEVDRVMQLQRGIRPA